MLSNLEVNICLGVVSIFKIHENVELVSVLCFLCIFTSVSTIGVPCLFLECPDG